MKDQIMRLHERVLMYNDGTKSQNLARADFEAAVEKQAQEIERIKAAWEQERNVSDMQAQEIERLQEALDCDRAILKARSGKMEALCAELETVKKEMHYYRLILQDLYVSINQGGSAHAISERTTPIIRMAMMLRRDPKL